MFTLGGFTKCEDLLYIDGTEGGMNVFLLFASLLCTLVVTTGPAFIVSTGPFSTARDKVAPYHKLRNSFTQFKKMLFGFIGIIKSCFLPGFPALFPASFSSCSVYWQFLSGL